MPLKEKHAFRFSRRDNTLPIIPDDVFDLYKLRTGEDPDALVPEQIARVEKGHLGRQVSFLATEAVVPPRYPFTVDQVVDAIATCAKLMYPTKPVEEGKFEIKVVRSTTKPDKAREEKRGGG